MSALHPPISAPAPTSIPLSLSALSSLSDEYPETNLALALVFLLRITFDVGTTLHVFFLPMRSIDEIYITGKTPRFFVANWLNMDIVAKEEQKQSTNKHFFFFSGHYCEGGASGAVSI